MHCHIYLCFVFNCVFLVTNFYSVFGVLFCVLCFILYFMLCFVFHSVFIRVVHQAHPAVTSTSPHSPHLPHNLHSSTPSIEIYTPHPLKNFHELSLYYLSFNLPHNLKPLSTLSIEIYTPHPPKNCPEVLS